MEQRLDLKRAGRLAEAKPPELSAAALGARLMARFQKAGFTPADVPVLQPVEPFLELSGEDIRRRLFVTADEDGGELCLRPEFTIPAALAYLKAGVVGRRADWAYFGPVFRHRPGQTGEFFQFGAESIGRTDHEAADADLLADVIAATLDEARPETLLVSIGDLSLFARLLQQLQLPPVLARRLALALGEGRIETALGATVSPSARPEAKGLARYSGVLDALKGADPAEAKAFVKDLLSLAGISAVGGRTAEDIASRFLDRASEEQPLLSGEQSEIIRRFLAISGDPDHVAGALRSWAREARLDFTAAIDRFELRSGFLEARGLDLKRIEASAGFARNLDYYSGFVFEIRRETGARPLAGGGRYDRLFERLGHDVPALGAAIWVERLMSGEVQR
jgi:ATP phosphoribosyltransferase regulatory subunit